MERVAWFKVPSLAGDASGGIEVVEHTNRRQWFVRRTWDDGRAPEWIESEPLDDYSDALTIALDRVGAFDALHRRWVAIGVTTPVETTTPAYLDSYRRCLVCDEPSEPGRLLCETCAAAKGVRR